MQLQLIETDCLEKAPTLSLHRLVHCRYHVHPVNYHLSTEREVDYVFQPRPHLHYDKSLSKTTKSRNALDILGG